MTRECEGAKVASLGMTGPDKRFLGNLLDFDLKYY